MKKEYEPVYLPMPVSFEKKREWNDKGYRVVDAAFAPEGYEVPSEEKPKRSKSKEL